VELALIVPVMLTIVGAATDIARVYGAWVALDSATRDAAEQVATSEGLSSNFTTANTHAKAVVCGEMANVPGFVAPVGQPTNCSQPAVTLTWSAPSTVAAGASPTYPIGSATVTATLPFRTLFSYPFFTQNGAWILTSTQSYSVIQGR
jgi:Flp pilus assembly protein TadG